MPTLSSFVQPRGAAPEPLSTPFLATDEASDSALAATDWRRTYFVFFLERFLRFSRILRPLSQYALVFLVLFFSFRLISPRFPCNQAVQEQSECSNLLCQCFYSLLVLFFSGDTGVPSFSSQGFFVRSTLVAHVHLSSMTSLWSSRLLLFPPSQSLRFPLEPFR